MIHALAVLDDDAFEQVADVLAAIGGGFEEVEDLLPLDDGDRVAFLSKSATMASWCTRSASRSS